MEKKSVIPVNFNLINEHETILLSFLKDVGEHIFNSERVLDRYKNDPDALIELYKTASTMLFKIFEFKRKLFNNKEFTDPDGAAIYNVFTVAAPEIKEKLKKAFLMVVRESKNLIETIDEIKSKNMEV